MKRTMRQTKSLFPTCAALLALSWLCCPFAVDAQNILTNGGFEIAPFPTGWSAGVGVTSRAGLNGSPTAALVPGASQIEQTRSTAPIGTPSSFSLDFFLAAGQPGVPGKNSLEFQILYQGDTAKGFLRMGVTDLNGGGVGDLWVVDGASIRTILFTNAITYSTGVGTGSEVIHPYRVRVNVNSLAGTYDVGLSLDGGTTLTNFSLGQSIWMTNPSITGFTNPTSLELKLVGGNTSGAVADQGMGIFDDVYLGVLVPEPSSLGLILVGGLAWRLRRRRDCRF